ncbi:MAG: ATP-binding protein [Caldilineales bacterium]
MPRLADPASLISMFTIDLQLLLFLLIALLALVAGGAVGLERWLRGRGRRQDEPGPALAALDQAPFGVLALSSGGDVQWANPAAQRLLDLAEPSGALPEEVWADRLLADVETTGGRYRLIPLPPDRWLRAWTSAGGQWIFIFDASDQQRAGQAAQRLLNDLGHELRTPLATILTHAEVQGLAGLPDATRQESLHLLKEETQRAVRLVNALLELGRLETGGELAQRPVDLLTLAEAAVQQTLPQAEARAIQISLEADTPLPHVLGDADQLLRVWLNLLNNAVKYCRPDDRVTVSLRREEAGVRGAVSDNGPGIARKHLPYLTQRFYRAAPLEQAGSGLGLALVEEILRQHGSTMQIESQTEGDATGTRLHFLLPTVAQPEEAQ